MIQDVNSQTYEELNVNEKKCAIAFLTNITTTYDLSKECHFFLDQTMDLNTLIWIFDKFFTIQKHFYGHFNTLKSKNNCEGIVDLEIIKIIEFKLFLCLQSHAIDELQV